MERKRTLSRDRAQFPGGFAGLGYAIWHFLRRPFPVLGESPLLDLMNYHTPTFYQWVMLWYYTAPFVTVMLAGLFVMSIWRVWFESRGRDFAAFGRLPTWPLSPDQKAPGIVIGEVHHPVEAREIFNPAWLTIPERGLYTGVAIFGAVGSGKTSACMNPFARQLLGWQAANPQMRAAALGLHGDPGVALGLGQHKNERRAGLLDEVKGGT